MKNCFDLLYSQVIEEYGKRKNVEKVAETLEISKVKVRRILITEGLWSSNTSEAVKSLFDQGLPTKKIAERLFVTEKAVQQYLPYTRGTYGREEKSADSRYSSSYRKRNDKANQNIQKLKANYLLENRGGKKR